MLVLSQQDCIAHGSAHIRVSTCSGHGSDMCSLTPCTAWSLQPPPPAQRVGPVLAPGQRGQAFPGSAQRGLSSRHWATGSGCHVAAWTRPGAPGRPWHWASGWPPDFLPAAWRGPAAAPQNPDGEVGTRTLPGCRGLPGTPVTQDSKVLPTGCCPEPGPRRPSEPGGEAVSAGRVCSSSPSDFQLVNEDG